MRPTSPPAETRSPARLQSLFDGVWGLIHLPITLMIAFVWGTFPEAAVAKSAVALHLVLAIVWLVGAWLWTRERGSRLWNDVLDVGGRRAPLFTSLAVVLTVELCRRSSVVPRAGLMATVLLPAWLALPWVAAKAWHHPGARRWATRSLIAVGAAVGVWALMEKRLDPELPAALPLGHHNLLAAFLVPLLPLLWPLFKGRAPDRAGSGIAGLIMLGALLATRSLGAALAVGAMILWSVLRWAASRRRDSDRSAIGTAFRLGTTIGVAAITAVYWQRHRLADILAGSDVSVQARWSYLQAAWQGFLERPFLGWGPGAAHWTVAEHLRPLPAVHPPGQIVADFHCLPLQLLYELGGLGLMIVAGWWLVVLRHASGRTRDLPEDARRTRRAAETGLLGLFVFSWTGLSLDVPALPWIAALVLGLRLATTGTIAPDAETSRGREGELTAGWNLRSATFVTVIGLVPVVGIAAKTVAPLDHAHLLYDRFVDLDGQNPETAQRYLIEAIDLDPAMPIYRWHLGLEHGDAGALAQAAADARGLALLWLTAGDGLDGSEDHPAAALAWRRACALDPLSAVAPLRLALSSATEPEARRAMAQRGLMAEPLLSAAAGWQGKEDVLWAATAGLRSKPDLDVYWRARIDDLARRRGRPEFPVGPETRDMGLEVDTVPSESLSLFAFRRRPSPVVVGRIALETDRLPDVDLVPVFDLPMTPSLKALFSSEACAVGSVIGSEIGSTALDDAP